MKKVLCLIAIALCHSPLQAQINGYIGVGYFSAGKSISDAYDSLPGVEIQRRGLAGFELNSRIAYIHESNFRADIGVGTGMLIGGDISFTNFPLSATVGYQYPLGSSYLYARAGVVHHIVSGDFIKEESSTAPLLAVGFESDSFFAELSVDTAKVTIGQGFVEEETSLSGVTFNLGYSF